MGKAQSKRSVDITTENKDGAVVAEGDSGKVGKIEDVDQPKLQLNGEANKDADSGEKQEEKKDDAEHEKDVATEKKEQPAEPAPAIETKPAEGEASAEAKETAKPTENGEGTETADTTLNESKDAVETGDDANVTSTPEPDSAKKPKKEKKKRLFSLRSLSFSRKTKPKKEENAANTTNGECEKVSEEATEEAAAVTNGEGKAEAEPTTNGTTEETKVNGAPVATPEESVTPPSNDDNSKPIAEIKQVAEETVKEVIVAASNSADEKINAIIAKPEVNEQDSQDKQITSTPQNAIETSVENIEDSNEKSNIETVPNNIENNETDQVTVMGLVDCTKTDPINNLPTSEPPALPDCPPPSQITVFAETAMSVDVNQVDPKSIPIIETQTENIQSESALVGETKIDLNIDAEQKTEININELAQNIENVKLSDEKEIPIESETEIEIKSNDVTAEATSDDLKNDNENEFVANDDEIQTNGEPIKDDVSNEISSPLPQNSLESLPSPQSSNVTPTNEIDDIATNEPNDNILPPPPADLIDTELPPPPAIIEFDIENALNDEGATTNGGAEQLNGSHKNGDDAATDHNSDKENGVANDKSVSEKLNGESAHKTIEDIATSPEILEKLAAANPPPSTEVVAAE